MSPNTLRSCTKANVSPGEKLFVKEDNNTATQKGSTNRAWKLSSFSQSMIIEKR